MTNPSAFIPSASVAPTLTATALVWATCAAIWDLKTRRIPNWLTLPAVTVGMAVNAYLDGMMGLGRSALGVVVGLGLLLVPFALGGMGAGDVKMLAAIGAFGGPVFVFCAFVYGALAGGVIGLAVILHHAFMLGGPRVGNLRLGAKTAFPYGVAILAGTVATVFLR